MTTYLFIKISSVYDLSWDIGTKLINNINNHLRFTNRIIILKLIYVWYNYNHVTISCYISNASILSRKYFHVQTYFSMNMTRILHVYLQINIFILRHLFHASDDFISHTTTDSYLDFKHDGSVKKIFMYWMNFNPRSYEKIHSTLPLFSTFLPFPFLRHRTIYDFVINYWEENTVEDI